VVGLGLTAADFARVARPPGKLAVATASQAVLLPLVAFAVIALLDPPLHRTLGLIVIAGCPGGAFSNFFVALARGATALSVAMTTTCTLVAVLTLPAVTAVGFAFFVADEGAVRPPVLLMIGQLIALLVLPLAAGMALRRWREPFFGRIRPRLQRVVLVAVGALILWILVDRAPDFPAELLPGFVTASCFLVPAMVLGELLGRLRRVSPGERLAYVVEHGFRNLGLAIVVTVTLLRQEGFLAFATVFFVTAVLYALTLVALFRHRPD
jgi:BASS family bile acid:Na+ symporter